jgi:transcriptional regulator with XRE-family HTH domain
MPNYIAATAYFGVPGGYWTTHNFAVTMSHMNAALTEAERWKAVGVLLADARRRCGLSKRRAAVAAGIAEITWRNLEKGEQQVARGIVRPVSPRDDTLYRAAVAVELDPAELFSVAERPYTEPPPPPAKEGTGLTADDRLRLDDLADRVARIEARLDDQLAHSQLGKNPPAA